MAVSLPPVIGEMRREDIEAVHEIERLSFTTPWPAYAFEQELAANRMARYLVVRVAEQPVAFAGLWLMADEAHITTFAVHPEWRRHGIAQRLMVALLELSLEIGAQRMTLEVRLGNLAAQSLYRRFGFVEVGRRPRYYTDDGEDALIMTTPELAGPTMRAVLATECTRAGADR
jgi:[ribosomal protein S18]-alanine N-acetyltransferase